MGNNYDRLIDLYPSTNTDQEAPELHSHWRKKPVVIIAHQLGSHGWPDELWQGVIGNKIILHMDQDPKHAIIHTLEGDHRADLGDFIIRGVAGEFYPCKPDIFAATYERADIAAPSAHTRERCGNCGAFGQKCYGNGPEGPDCEDWIGESNGRACCYACYAAPSAPAGDEGLAALTSMIEQVDAIYDSKLAREAREELTALQAENERLRKERDDWQKSWREVLSAGYKMKARAEAAEVVADQLAESLNAAQYASFDWKAGSAALAAHAKLKEGV